MADISVIATELEEVKSLHRLLDAGLPASEQGEILTISNPLIDNSALAAEVADWLLAESTQRHIYAVNWRQNPALEPGDVVTIEDEFGENRPARISRQEITYAGYLSGTTGARGDGP